MSEKYAATSTVSRVLMCGNTAEADRQILRKWAQHASENGGSFSIRNDWTENQWYTTYTINWPAASASKATTGKNHDY